MKKYVRFFDIKVWKDAHSLILKIYGITAKQFPKSELFGLTSQVRRSSSSIGANIAEGCEQQSKKQKINYLVISKATTIETENHLILARDLNYISNEQFSDLFSDCEQILYQLGGWIKSIQLK